MDKTLLIYGRTVKAKVPDGVLRWEEVQKGLGLCTIDRSEYYVLKDLSKSIAVATRKMVSYA